jgi:hypothetical protein
MKLVWEHAVPPISATVLYGISRATELAAKLIPEIVKSGSCPATSQSTGPFTVLVDVTTGASKVNTPRIVPKYHPSRSTMIDCSTPARAGKSVGGGMAHLRCPY